MPTFDQTAKSEFSALSPNYFNSAYFGPIPKRAREAGIQAIEQATNPATIPYEYWRPMPDEARMKFGQLLGVSGERISHHGGTSEVVSYISLGFPFKGTGTVVLMEGDYPSDIIPWMVNQERCGYKVLKLKEECFRDPELLRKNLPIDAKILNISHVMFNTGRRSPILEIGKLCQERGIFFSIDTSQSLGGLALTEEEVKGCDVIVGATYKWLLGPYGHAFAYWSERALKEISNVHLSWQTSSSASTVGNLLKYSTEPLPGARKFDRAQAPSCINMKMLMQSLDLLNEIGLGQVQQHNSSLVNLFLESFPRGKYEMVTPIGEHANIICLKPTAGDLESLQAALRTEKVGFTVREGNLRLSFHLFNTTSEVDHLVRALEKA